MVHPELKEIYINTARQMNNWGEVISFVTSEVTPYCFVMPKVFVSLYFYCTTGFGFGNDAFELSVPLW